jgi:hypothetical protein
MSTDDTSQTMSAYFTALGTGRFQQFFTADVTWTTIQSGAVVRGAEAVEGAINGMHAHMPDLSTRQLMSAQGVAYLEGTCAGNSDGDRIPFCVAYDLAADRIDAMRAYGDIASFVPPSP